MIWSENRYPIPDRVEDMLFGIMRRHVASHQLRIIEGEMPDGHSRHIP
jgi:hypothetical protein